MPSLERKYIFPSPNVINVSLEACIEDGRWFLQNSQIENGDGNYNQSFVHVLGEKSILDILPPRDFPLVFLDLMASTGTARDLFSKTCPKEGSIGIAVSLTDQRSPKEKKEDDYWNIRNIIGNIVLSSTWEKIHNDFEGNTPNLIIERGEAGISRLPVDQKLYYFLVNNAWTLLDVNGTMLFQIPQPNTFVRNSIPISEWVKLVKEAGIECYYSPGMPQYRFGELMLIKSQKSPRNLPRLKF